MVGNGDMIMKISIMKLIKEALPFRNPKRQPFEIWHVDPECNHDQDQQGQGDPDDFTEILEFSERGNRCRCHPINCFPDHPCNKNEEKEPPMQEIGVQGRASSLPEDDIGVPQGIPAGVGLE